MVVQNHGVINCIYIFFWPLTNVWCSRSFHSFWISINILSMNLKHLGNSRNWPPKVTFSKDDDQQISSAKVLFIVDLAWEEIIGIIQFASSSNSINMKLVKFLNKKGVACIMAKTSSTHIARSTNFLVHSSSWSVIRFLKLRTLKIHWKNITTFWSISSNNISSSLEEESWLELEDDILCKVCILVNECVRTQMRSNLHTLFF